jgi:hypothetical protein
MEGGKARLIRWRVLTMSPLDCRPGSITSVLQVMI